jgi:Mg2+/Co2+ transporter CorC
MIDVVEKKNLKIVFTKDIMSKLQNDAKNIQDVAQLINDAIKIQAKSAKTRKILQKKLEIIKKLSDSITIRCRTYYVRVNNVKMNHINTIN